MSHASLTARYRPQTFGQAAGQEVIKAILSRAALEDRIAPAYLFSGTRGVGKTTLARVFAKALNCATAPTAEPCNECESCRKITAGMAVDVLEMDGASNRGIEDAKRLREGVNYAPMEGRYKIFIIDEAHMLSRDAFNALLKTIEEPPPRVTFIMATTEPHKFPPTIISRCQHFVFKRLNNSELEAHLAYILNAEGAAFEPEAVALLAKRAAGSVRDGMSLLGQTLALGGEKLTVAAVRETLGLAGEDMFLALLEAVQSGDSLAALELSKTILDQGVDLGFFLRELSGMWRNLFMLRQAGAAAAQTLDLTPDEARTWLAATDKLALTHIHACWQLTLEGQRRVLNALEPAQALELLLLNLTVLPALIPVQNLPGASLPDIPARAADKQPAPASESTPEAAPAPTTSPVSEPAPEPALREDIAPGPGPSSSSAKSKAKPTSALKTASAQASAPVEATSTTSPAPASSPAQPSPAQSATVQTTPAPLSGSESAPFPAYAADEPPIWDEDAPPPELPMSEAMDRDLSSDAGFTALTDPAPPEAYSAPAPEPAEQPKQAAPVSTAPASAAPAAESATPENATPDASPLDWDEFARFCLEAHGLDLASGVMGNIFGEFNASGLLLICPSQLSLDRLAASEAMAKIKSALAVFAGPELAVNLTVSQDRHKTKLELREEAQKHPKVLLLQAQLGAGLLDCRDTRK